MVNSQEILNKINSLVNSISTMQIELINLKNLVIQKEMENLDSQYLDQSIKKVSPTIPVVNGNGKGLAEKAFDF